MKWHTKIHASLLAKFAHFLEEHPGFWPELVGEDAVVCGFHVGSCSLSIQDMEKLVAAQSCREAQPAVRKEPQRQECEER